MRALKEESKISDQLLNAEFDLFSDVQIKIVDEIGHGGQGTVYRVRKIGVSEKIDAANFAVKVLMHHSD